MSTNIALADSRPLRGGACDVTVLRGGAGLGRWVVRGQEQCSVGLNHG